MKIYGRGLEEIREIIKRREVRIGVVGLGRVGMIIASAFLDKGFGVVGYDVNHREIIDSLLRESESLHPERTVREIMTKAFRSNKLIIRDLEELSSEKSDVYIVIVPVSWRSNKPGLEALEKASVALGRNIERGDFIILESSAPPGTTRRFMIPLIEEHSKLIAGKDFGVAYSPERVSIGRGFEDLTKNYPKIVSGIDEYSLEIASIIYSEISSKGVIRASSIETAEFTKLAEGVYRDVNIALANALAEAARLLGIDFWEVIALANTQPYSHIHFPGPGVGGVCLPYYPRFLTWSISNVSSDCWCAELINLAREINDSQPRRIIDLVIEGLKLLNAGDFYEKKICVLGLSYRGDIPDSRESPTYAIARELLLRGFSDVTIHDPFINRDPVLDEMRIRLTRDLVSCIRDSHVIIVSTDHSLYRDLSTEKLKEISGRGEILILDNRNIIRYEAKRSWDKKCLYGGVGKKWSWC